MWVSETQLNKLYRSTYIPSTSINIYSEFFPSIESTIGEKVFENIYNSFMKCFIENWTKYEINDVVQETMKGIEKWVLVIPEEIFRSWISHNTRVNKFAAISQWCKELKDELQELYGKHNLYDFSLIKFDAKTLYLGEDNYIGHWRLINIIKISQDKIREIYRISEFGEKNDSVERAPQTLEEKNQYLKHTCEHVLKQYIRNIWVTFNTICIEDVFEPVWQKKLPTIQPYKTFQSFIRKKTNNILATDENFEVLEDILSVSGSLFSYTNKSMSDAYSKISKEKTTDIPKPSEGSSSSTSVSMARRAFFAKRPTITESDSTQDTNETHASKKKKMFQF